MRISEERYISHYGVKGMKWGIRRDRERKGNRSPSEQRSSRNRKLGATIGLGLMASAVIFAVSRGKSVRSLPTKAGQKAAKAVVNQSGKKMASSVSRPSGKPKISPEAQRLIDTITNAHRETVRLANEDLKRGYERIQTPFPLREYLPTW